MDNYVLWGSAGHAKVLADVIAMQGGKVVVLFDNKPSAESALPGVPLFHGATGFEAWIQRCSSVDKFRGAVAIGGGRGKDRVDLASFLKKAGLQLTPLIHSSAAVSPTAEIGEASQILANTVVAADVSLGPASIVNNSANVDHECCIGKGVHVGPGAVLCGCVIVEDYAFIGAGAVLLPRLRIGKGAVVGAGSVVTRDVPAGATVCGNPAKIIRSV